MINGHCRTPRNMSDFFLQVCQSWLFFILRTTAFPWSNIPTRDFWGSNPPLPLWPHPTLQHSFPYTRNSNTLATWCEELTRWKRPWCWERLRAGGGEEEEMAGWHHWLNGHRFGWTPGAGDGQGGLACCGSWGGKESDTTERLNWTELTQERVCPVGGGRVGRKSWACSASTLPLSHLCLPTVGCTAICSLPWVSLPAVAGWRVWMRWASVSPRWRHT